MERRIINPWTWQDAMGFVQAMELGPAKRTLVCSGQTSVDANGAPLHAGDMAAQLRQAVANLETVLVAGGFDLTDVVRLNYYTTDIDAFMQGAAAGGLMRLAEASCRPASTLLGVARLFHPALMVEIEATAMK
ncbi:MAG: RidA family protein [Deltaproteobacteria bacterium]|nr:RidA family protein [Deltaproteobacteria bacterium]